MADALTYYGVSTGATNSSNYVEVSYATQTRLDLCHGAFVSNALGQLAHCRDSTIKEREEIQLQIDGGVVLVRDVAQRFKQYNSIIPKYKVTAININCENTLFTVAYDGKLSNARTVDEAKNVDVWHLDIWRLHFITFISVLCLCSPTVKNTPTKQWGFLVATRFIATEAI